MSVPKYLQIKQNLIYKIKNGDFLPGDKFYSEAELKREYGVSGITVVRALQELVNEGYLVRYQGKGTYVSKGKKGKVIKLTDLEKYRNAQEFVKVVSINLMKDKDIAKELSLGLDEEFYHIKRIRYVDDTPVMLQNSYVLKQYINESEIKNLQIYASIYEKIRDDFGINLYQADSKEILEIVYPLPKRVSKLLSIKDEVPSVFTKRHTYLFDGSVIEYIESYKRWDYFSIQIEPV